VVGRHFGAGSGACQGRTWKLCVSSGQGCDQRRLWWLLSPRLQGLRLFSKVSLSSPSGVIIRLHLYVAPSPPILLFSGGRKLLGPSALSVSGDPGRPQLHNAKAAANSKHLSVSLCELAEVSPFSLALSLARRRSHHPAARRRGKRLRAALVFPASSSGSLETNAQSTLVSAVLSLEPAQRTGKTTRRVAADVPFLSPLGSPGPPSCRSAPAAAELPLSLTARWEHLGVSIRAQEAGLGGASARGAGRGARELGR
jgi:hypothetical protein